MHWSRHRDTFSFFATKVTLLQGTKRAMASEVVPGRPCKQAKHMHPCRSVVLHEVQGLSHPSLPPPPPTPLRMSGYTFLHINTTLPVPVSTTFIPVFIPVSSISGKSARQERGSHPAAYTGDSSEVQIDVPPPLAACVVPICTFSVTGTHIHFGYSRCDT